MILFHGLSFVFWVPPNPGGGASQDPTVLFGFELLYERSFSDNRFLCSFPPMREIDIITLYIHHVPVHISFRHVSLS